MDAEELVDRFQFLDDWQDRYRYLIDLGKTIPPMDDADKIDEHIVRGCMSRVWVVLRPGAAPGTFDVIADSDSSIVKGLIAVAQVVFSGKTRAQMAAADIEATFEDIGLNQHLSPNRRNGFFSMVERIRTGTV